MNRKFKFGNRYYGLAIQSRLGVYQLVQEGIFVTYQHRFVKFPVSCSTTHHIHICVWAASYLAVDVASISCGHVIKASTRELAKTEFATKEFRRHSVIEEYIILAQNFTTFKKNISIMNFKATLVLRHKCSPYSQLYIFVDIISIDELHRDKASFL